MRVEEFIVVLKIFFNADLKILTLNEIEVQTLWLDKQSLKFGFIGSLEAYKYFCMTTEKDTK